MDEVGHRLLVEVGINRASRRIRRQSGMVHLYNAHCHNQAACALGGALYLHSEMKNPAEAGSMAILDIFTDACGIHLRSGYPYHGYYSRRRGGFLFCLLLPRH